MGVGALVPKEAAYNCIHNTYFRFGLHETSHLQMVFLDQGSEQARSGPRITLIQENRGSTTTGSYGTCTRNVPFPARSTAAAAVHCTDCMETLRAYSGGYCHDAFYDTRRRLWCLANEPMHAGRRCY